MGSFPSSTSVEADAEMFRQLKSKYEEALQGGASEDALFEVMKKAVMEVSAASVSEDVAVPAAEVTEPPVPSGMSPEEAEAKQKELDLAFRVACGAFHKGKAQANLSRAQTLFKEGEGGLKVNVDAVDADGWTPLIHACGEGHLNIVEFLTETAGVNVDIQALDKCTALWTACFNGRRDVAQHLLLVGADDTIKGEPEGEPVTTAALAARRNRHPGLADLLDTERTLRAADDTRQQRQKAREMTIEEFRDSMRKAVAPKEAPA